MRNPKWHRDEIILALDLYFDPNRGSIDSRNQKVIELSEMINKLPIFSDKPDEEKFRNPNGVSLKLSNFLAIDPGHNGKGMESYSKLDEEVFKEFVNDRERLRKVAQHIKEVVQSNDLLQKINEVENDENVLLDSVQEGQVLYKLHKYRERNSKIIKAKKDVVLKNTHRLACEVCDFDFNEKYGPLGKDFIECHHTKPLADDLKDRVTSINDLVLVCSNCHRMLHRNITLLTVADLKEKMNQAANSTREQRGH